MSLADSLYARLPVWGQHLAVSLFGLYWRQLRFGPGYAQSLKEYRQREFYSLQQWQEWQREQLRPLLTACAQHVPYYCQHWSEEQKQAARQGNLQALPLLEKAALRAEAKAFLRQDLRPGAVQEFFTSGSTGTPISSFYSLQEVRRALALREARSANWAGVSFSRPRATFSGRLVEPNPLSHGPFYRFNLAENQVYFSAFHLRPQNAHAYAQALERHKIEWATGYAVSFYLLAKFMLQEGVKPPSSLRAVITTSEKLTCEMRQVMEQAYGCRVYEEYSTVENAIFASECEQGRLHLSPDVSVVEILRPDGSPCSPGEIGEVVVTGLSRSYHPLIRFRLGDLAAWDETPCACGRHMPVLREVVGRVEDVVIGPDGRQMVRFHGIFAHQPHIIEGQIVQETLKQIRVRLVPAPGFDQADEREVIQRVQQRLGPEVAVSIELVSEIPRSRAGKFQAVISHLKP